MDLSIMEPQWHDYNIIQNILVRLYNTKRRVYADPNLETQVNTCDARYILQLQRRSSVEELQEISSKVPKMRLDRTVG